MTGCWLCVLPCCYGMHSWSIYLTWNCSFVCHLISYTANLHTSKSLINNSSNIVQSCFQEDNTSLDVSRVTSVVIAIADIIMRTLTVAMTNLPSKTNALCDMLNRLIDTQKLFDYCFAIIIHIFASWNVYLEINLLNVSQT